MLSPARKNRWSWMSRVWRRRDAHSRGRRAKKTRAPPDFSPTSATDGRNQLFSGGEGAQVLELTRAIFAQGV